MAIDGAKLSMEGHGSSGEGQVHLAPFLTGLLARLQARGAR